LAYPTDRILGGEEPGRPSPGSRKRAYSEALSIASRCSVETSGAREAHFGAESGLVGSSVATSGARARSRWSRRDFAILALRSGRCRGSWWTSSTRLSALHGSHFREPRVLGVGCIGVLALRCALALGGSAGCRTSSSHRDVERVQLEPVVTPARVPEDPFVPAEVLRGLARIAGHTLNAR
jgi:hypothetical protein